MAQDLSQSERTARLLTPERVPLTVPLAGLGERAIAYGIDLGIVVAFLMAGFFIYNFWGDLGQDLGTLSAMGLTLTLAAGATLVLCYDVAFEIWGRGQTPGKRIMRLRVVQQDGRTPDVITACLRNALRIIDFLPMLYGVGIVSLFVTGTRRIGDLIANTVVLTERQRGKNPLAVLSTTPSEPTDTVPNWPDEDALAALSILERSQALDEKTAQKLCHRILKRIDPPLASAAKVRAASRQALQRGLDALSQAKSGALHRIVHLVALDDALHGALNALSNSQKSRSQQSRAQKVAAVEHLDATQRAATSALMLATHRGLPAHFLEALSLRILDAERMKTASPPLYQSIQTLISWQLPKAVYQERAMVLRAAVILFGTILVGALLAYANPQLGRAVVGDDLAIALDQGQNWTQNASNHGAFTIIIFNNIRVGLAAFVLGLLWGAGTVGVLVANGLHIGGVVGYALSVDHFAPLGRFMLAHGPLELSCVCIAGGAGLCLGRALLAPGPRTRLAALRLAGATAGRMVAVASLGFLAIGVVEGMVSPGELFPIWLNALLGVSLLGAAWSWVFVYGKNAAERA